MTSVLPHLVDRQPASAERASRPPLAERFRAALLHGEHAVQPLADHRPRDRRDLFLTLLEVYDLSMAPLDQLGARARLAGSPAVAALKARLEAEWLAELESVDVPDEIPSSGIEGMRKLAARDRLPAAYRWLAQDATWEQLVTFLALEGGPDGGFDDLVAVCQVGLSGSAKVELAQNYWDEMGNGRPDAVHTTMHQRMAAAIGMPDVPREEQPVEGLERVALGGLFATNHWLQPEMLGALGLLELQAGPRCRLVLQAFDRLGAPREAYPFYAEHAEVDPRHGKDWLDKAVGPLCGQHPDWAPRILRGAWWRSRTNHALFARLAEDLPVSDDRSVHAA